MNLSFYVCGPSGLMQVTYVPERHSSSPVARPDWAAPPRKPCSPPAVTSCCSTSTPRPARQPSRRSARRRKFAQADVTSEDQVKAAVDLAVSAFGGLHGVVNAAGIGPAAKVLGRNGPHPLDLFEKTMRVNARRHVQRDPPGGRGHRRRTRQQATGERGVIVNTASIAAYDGQIGQPAYAASKGAIVAMTLPIAREFAQLGIRVVTIAPGIFDTPLLAGLPEPARVSLGQQVPFPSRLGRPAGIRRARASHHRERDVERRSDSPRRRAADGAEIVDTPSH